MREPKLNLYPDLSSRVGETAGLDLNCTHELRPSHLAKDGAPDI